MHRFSSAGLNMFACLLPIFLQPKATQDGKDNSDRYAEQVRPPGCVLPVEGVQPRPQYSEKPKCDGRAVDRADSRPVIYPPLEKQERDLQPRSSSVGEGAIRNIQAALDICGASHEVIIELIVSGIVSNERNRDDEPKERQGEHHCCGALLRGAAG